MNPVVDFVQHPPGVQPPPGYVAIRVRIVERGDDVRRTSKFCAGGVPNPGETETDLKKRLVAELFDHIKAGAISEIDGGDNG